MSMRVAADRSVMSVAGLSHGANCLRIEMLLIWRVVFVPGGSIRNAFSLADGRSLLSEGELACYALRFDRWHSA